MFNTPACIYMCLVLCNCVVQDDAKGAGVASLLNPIPFAVRKQALKCVEIDVVCMCIFSNDRNR